MSNRAYSAQTPHSVINSGILNFYNKISDNSSVNRLKRSASDVRNGGEVVVVRDEEDERIPEERWRLAVHPRFQDTGSDTQHFCAPRDKENEHLF